MLPLLALAVLACGRPGRKPAGGAAVAVVQAAPAGGDPQTMDTVRGVVLVSGGQRFDQVTLQTSRDTVALTGSAVRQIARAAGADVWAEGFREAPARLQVSRFVVRRVGGRPALDGVLVGDGDRLFVLTSDGARHVVSGAPRALWTHLGERVWLTGVGAHTRIEYGVLQSTP